MNYKSIFTVIGKALVVESALLMLPILVSLYYKESCYIALLITAAVAFVLGFAITKASNDSGQNAHEREVFVMVGLVWIILSLVGALPYVISGAIPSYVDAFFETVSGFTTTGATILDNIEVIPKGILFWRSLTHWIGGMGILVFMAMLGSKVQGRTMNVLKAEMPGPVVGKLVPRARETARVLYTIYIAMTIIQIVLLYAGGLNLFDSVISAMGTASTGGFAAHTSSIAEFSKYSQWIIAIFMVLFSINFNLYYYIVKGNVKDALKDEETKLFIAIVIISSVLITINIIPQSHGLEEAARFSFFQVSSIISTTGFCVVDYNAWPEKSKAILLILMVLGGCAGSTAGGLKISRLLIVLKSIKQEMLKLVQPRRVGGVSINKKYISDEVAHETNVYFALYAVILTLCTIVILAVEQLDIFTAFVATTACFSNVGPSMGIIGPTSSFSGFTDFSKVLFSIAMIAGRLEIYPILITLALPFKGHRQ